MERARITTDQEPMLELSSLQQEQIDWRDDEGEEPGGG